MGQEKTKGRPYVFVKLDDESLRMLDVCCESLGINRPVAIRIITKLFLKKIADGSDFFSEIREGITKELQGASR